jgi:hypothetical protein
MADGRKNLASTTVAVAPIPASSGVTLTVATGQGSWLPAVPFNVTAWPDGQAATPANAEIVRVTDVTGDVVTMTRAQEGTSAKSIAVGWNFAATITLKMVTDSEALASTALASHTGNVSNPHATTKTQVGLGNVPNIDTTGDYRPGGTTIPLTDGGTGATTAAGARASLGLGSAATQAATAFDSAGAAAAAQAASQPLDADLTAVAGVSTAAYGRGLLGLASATALKAETDGVAARATFSNADRTWLAAELYLAQTGTLSAPRTVTLPAANTVPAGRPRIVVDESGTCTATNTISIARTGADTVNGATAAYVLTSPNSPIVLYSDGVSAWVAAKPNSNEVKQLLAGAGARLTTSGDSTTLDVLMDVQEFSAVGAATWTKPANAFMVFVDVVGAGGGGAGGASKAAGGIRGGGGGGGAGGRKRVWLSASDLGATETVTIADGGPGAAGGASGADGSNATAATSTSFGTWVTVTGPSGFFLANKGTSAPGGTGATANPDTEITGAGGGSTSSTAAAGDGVTGLSQVPGGGAGGGAIDAANVARNGGAGGVGDFGGTAGTAGTGSAGANGGAGASPTSHHGIGGGGGGGAPSTSSATSGGTGGAGGAPGGGGGGGGAGTAGGAGTGGTGGKGGKGRVRVITYIATT